MKTILTKLILWVCRVFSIEILDEYFYARIFLDSPDPLVVCNEDSKMVVFNESFCEVLGYEVYELRNKKLSMVIPEKYRENHIGYFNEYRLRPKKRPMANSRVLSALTKSGEEIKVRISLSFLKYNGKTFYCGSLRVEPKGEPSA